ncbi:PREDICTED: plant UBX domain-containing protein 9 [Tarenaya hassleriana]|uniref:plant UBX domain-containing protein 9 n=1 Tax=Tarenaya hassleriana TaxID=28532 RepID=UPI00053C0A0F|nr:PREDICTED: plant UBX domain-containing protein 9 [Tarenaya hassleriana]
MARPTRDAIRSYISITGASESLAIQRLEEHGCNLAEAVNAHFREMETIITNPTSSAYSDYNIAEDSRQVQVRDTRQGTLPSLFAAARAFRPSLLLDPNYRRNILRQIGVSAFTGSPPPASHTGEATGFPAYPMGRNDQTHLSGPGQISDYARTSFSHGSQIGGETHRDDGSYLYDNDAEEEMIKAAIEASKEDVRDVHGNRRNTLSRDSSNIFSQDDVIKREDEDLARAISLSLEAEELENAMREQITEIQPHHMEDFDPHKSGTNEINTPKPGSSSVHHDLEDIKQKQPIVNSSHHEHHLQHVESAHDPDKWGGIPSTELHEAIMMEKALFNGIANDTSHKRSPGHHTEEREGISAVKESFLPVEPSVDNEGAITLLIRMPDSNRHGRRFLRSDKVKYLFDFIDAGGAVKPGTYRVVRPYPRRAFNLDDGASTFEELGLTNKQEVLFLELI